MADHAASILIIDDDADVACAAQVLLDLNFTPGRIDGHEGLAVLGRLRALPNPPAVIALTAYADVPLAVEALKRGASDFITKPWDNARLAAAVASALARRAPVPSASATAALMGESKAMRELKAMIASVGPTEANVLVLGENGVGKELVARALHLASQRSANQFTAVDMGALPESTVESELFGHRRGAFTDAKESRAGRFQAARGGTLFLDEIGNMPIGAQAKLLTALERREVTPIGADRPEPIDVRIVSATNVEEERLFDPAVFRPDLLFRLNTIVLRVPPLRERREDIEPLLLHYLRHYEAQYGKQPRAISGPALAALHANAWTGNVRALRHSCERAAILAAGAEYEYADFGLPGSAPAPAAAARGDGGDTDLRLDARERDTIAAALAKANGNISHAARMLGLSRAALYRKLGKHGL